MKFSVLLSTLVAVLLAVGTISCNENKDKGKGSKTGKESSVVKPASDDAEASSAVDSDGLEDIIAEDGVAQSEESKHDEESQPSSDDLVNNQNLSTDHTSADHDNVGSTINKNRRAMMFHGRNKTNNSKSNSLGPDATDEEKIMATFFSQKGVKKKYKSLDAKNLFVGLDQDNMDVIVMLKFKEEAIKATNSSFRQNPSRIYTSGHVKLTSFAGLENYRISKYAVFFPGKDYQAFLIKKENLGLEVLVSGLGDVVVIGYLNGVKKFNERLQLVQIKPEDKISESEVNKLEIEINEQENEIMRRAYSEKNMIETVSSAFKVHVLGRDQEVLSANKEAKENKKQALKELAIFREKKQPVILGIMNKTLSDLYNTTADGFYSSEVKLYTYSPLIFDVM